MPRDGIAAHVAEAARRFGLPEAWIEAVMRAESAGDPRAVSSAGAMGLMQLMPATWADLRIRYGFGGDPYDPRDNILAGAAYLRELHDRYGAPGFLAAYNAGPGRYEDALTTGRPLPSETRAYLAKLAPVVGLMRGRGVILQRVDLTAWTRSALFADLSTVADTGRDAADPPLDRPSSARSDAHRSVQAVDHAGIFVRRSHQTTAP
ncbi:lytic transglycosylase domain-containing protein [Phenylobacterium sp.]|uniref:lytic transglycosylase domain-containing protein n=1 Tax=Phenylobacterium sp. TaxID=1871053 RepID=UPI003BA9A7B7